MFLVDAVLIEEIVAKSAYAVKLIVTGRKRRRMRAHMLGALTETQEDLHGRHF